MSSKSSNLPPNDPKVIAEIVDKLKKQGLFDKFRKDCLADVDTKPAYQNLCRRVDTFCTNFLTNIQWTPDLNKNKLRDSLRNEITQGKMLSGGVDHIVSQVVNPKIQKFFKPDIDAVVCEFFGINPEERAEKLRQREQQRAEPYRQLGLDSPTKQHAANVLGHLGLNQQSFPGATNFGMHGMMGVTGYMVNQMQQQQQHQASIPSGVNISNMAGISTSMAQSIQNTLSQMPGSQMSTMFPNMPPTIPNFSVPPPGFGPTTATYNPNVPPPHMAQTASSQGFTTLSQSFATTATAFQQIPGLPGMAFNNQMLLSGLTASEIVGGYAMQGAMASGLDVSPIKPDKKDDKASDKKEKEKKKEVPTLTVEDLLNVALPTKASRERPKKDRERDRHWVESQGTGRPESGSPIIIHNRRDGSGKSDWRGDRLEDKGDLRGDRLEDKGDRRGDRLEDKGDRHGDRLEDKGDRRGDRLEDKADRCGDRLEDKGDRRGDRLDDKGDRHGDRLEDKGERRGEDRRLEDKLDRSGSDRRSDRLEEKSDRLEDKEDRRGDRGEDRRSDYSGSYHSDMSRSERGRAGDEYHSTRSPARGAAGGARHDLFRPEGKQPPEPPPEDQPPEPKEKVYHFAWDDVEPGAVSEMTISSVHTSDLSSFDEGSSDASGLEDISSDELRSEDEAGTKPPEPPEPPKDEPITPDHSEVKAHPQKLVALRYNYSDSEDEETREERKTRIAEEKEERYLKRQLRRAELEARKEEKKEKKAAEKKKAKDDGVVLSQEPSTDRRPGVKERRLRSARTKEALKEQLRAEKREQKVMDRRMALRRQRKRNSKYMSDEFTSIFTDKRKILSNEGYVEPDHDPDYSPTREHCDAREPRSARKAANKVGPVSPSTPTQDEVEYGHHVPDPEAPGHVGHGRKRLVPGDDHAAGRPTTPFSDSSEKTESDMGRGRRRRRTLSGRHSPDLEEKKPVRPHEPPALQEQRAHSQRYDDSDLYKPHTSYRTRRRGTSPLKEVAPAGRRGVGWVAGSPPAPGARGGRPPSPPSPGEEYHHTGPVWQRHGSQEAFKSGRPQHFPASLERQAKVALSPECRPGLYPPRASPDHTASGKFHPRGGPGPAPTTPKARHAGSDSGSVHLGSDDGAEKPRPKVPLSHINFGEAAKQARTYVRNVTKPPPPPPTERPPDEFIDFGEAEWQVRQLKANAPTTCRPERRPGATVATAGIQRPYRRGGMSPRGDTFRGGFKRDRFQRGGLRGISQGIPFGAVQGSLHRIPPVPQGIERSDLRVSDHSDNVMRGQEREARADPLSNWNRQSSQEDEGWLILPKVKSLEEEKEEWESISDDEELGDNLDDSHEADKIGNEDDKFFNWGQERSRDKASPIQSETGGSQERPRERSYDSGEDNTQDRAVLREDKERYMPQERFPAPGTDQQHCPPKDTEVEEGEEVDDSDYIPEETQDNAPKQPPEPPPEIEQQPASRKRQRSESVSSGELKDDDDDDAVAELPKTGVSPTAKQDELTEMPRPGLSPSERDSPSHSLIRPPSPTRSVHRSPTRSVHRSPTRSVHRSPTRSIPRSPTKSIPRSPTRSIPRSPTRSIQRSPRSMPRSPTRSVPRSPTRSSSRSITRSPTRSMPRSPTRSMPRSPTRPVPRSPVKPRPSYGGPATPPGQVPQLSPMGEIISSPESGEVGDFDSSSEKGSAKMRSPFTSPEADHSPSPPQRQEMRERGDRSPPSPSGSRHYRHLSPTRGVSSTRGARGAGLGARGPQYIAGGRLVHSSRRGPAIPTTRSSRKRSEEESMPIAKRLRR